MIKNLMKRAFLVFSVAALLAIAHTSFRSSTTFAQGGFDYMCDAWEETCDNGSGDWWDSGGGGDGGDPTGGANYYCPYPDGCSSFGCHAVSYTNTTQVCSTYAVVDGASCPGTLTCKKVGS
jgi:hypothetical protein